MKLKISQLNPNPFKKHISKGKLNQDQVNSLKANMKKLGLMDAIPVVKIGDKYHVVSHHHRLEALRQEFNKNYEVDVVLRNYDNETMLRGMVTENITQRAGDFREIKENLALIRSELKKNPDWLQGLYIYRPCTYQAKGKDSESGQKQNKHQHQSQGIGTGQIYRWVHNVDTEEKEEDFKKNDKVKNQIMSLPTMAKTLQIEDNLDESLKEQIEKKHDKTKDEREDKNTLNYSQAVLLATIKDKKEQKELASVLKNSKEQRVREQGKLLSIYKEAPEEICQKCTKEEENEIQN